MGMVFNMLGLVCFLAALACGVMILIHAFKESAVQGLLCLCVPFYILYYAIVKFEHEKKGLILGIWLGGSFVGGFLQGIGASLAGGG